MRATGTVTLFDGFLTLYLEGQDDEADEDGSRLPKLAAGDATKVEKVNPAQHFTEPPPRYSEASLVKKLEELGIGRPSTYASIISTLRDRAYVRHGPPALHPGRQGPAGHHLPATASSTAMWLMISPPIWKKSWTKSPTASSTGSSCCAISGRISPRPSARPRISRSPRSSTSWIACWRRTSSRHGEDGVDPRKCPACENGRLNLKLGRFGAFVGCTNYPECKFTRQIGAKPGEGDAGPVELGLFPGTEEKVTLRSGRFGPYVQLGEGDKPKRSGMPKGTDKRDVDLEMAMKLLVAAARSGRCIPKTARMITANFGRFGPYVAHNGIYASLDSPEDVFEIGLNHAVTLLAEKKAKGRAAAARRR